MRDRPWTIIDFDARNSLTSVSSSTPVPDTSLIVKSEIGGFLLKDSACKRILRSRASVRGTLQYGGRAKEAVGYAESQSNTVALTTNMSLPEQLMGEQLMSGPGTRAPQLSITDPKVCRSYLVGTCPHDLFTNTKQDLGLCPKTHNEALKAEYEAADEQQKRKWGFEFDYLRDMQKYIDECNRRIDTAQRRLEKTPDEIRQTNALVSSVGSN